MLAVLVAPLLTLQPFDWSVNGARRVVTIVGQATEAAADGGDRDDVDDRDDVEVDGDVDVAV